MGIMFWKSKATSEAAEKRIERRAVFLSNAINKVQTGWAKWMNRKTNNLSNRGKMWLLLSFCAASITLSLMIVFRNLKAGTVRIEFAKVSMPKITNEKSTLMQDTGIIDNLVRFRRYMDSLSKDSIGRRTFDSIQKARPGLLDSIVMAEKLYNKN